MTKKLILFVSSLLLSITCFSQDKSTIYCKLNGQAVDLLEQRDAQRDGTCQEALLFGYSAVCFTGNREDIFEIIKNEINIGDEYKLVNPWYNGQDDISYTAVDRSAGNLKARVKISQCTDSFFE
jgi:hypothetical protein